MDDVNEELELSDVPCSATPTCFGCGGKMCLYLWTEHGASAPEHIARKCCVRLSASPGPRIAVLPACPRSSPPVWICFFNSVTAVTWAAQLKVNFLVISLSTRHNVTSVTVPVHVMGSWFWLSSYTSTSKHCCVMALLLGFFHTVKLSLWLCFMIQANTPQHCLRWCPGPILG